MDVKDENGYEVWEIEQKPLRITFNDVTSCKKTLGRLSRAFYRKQVDKQTYDSIVKGLKTYVDMTLIESQLNNDKKIDEVYQMLAEIRQGKN